MKRLDYENLSYVLDSISMVFLRSFERCEFLDLMKRARVLPGQLSSSLYCYHYCYYVES